jgi:hypothetical protein
MPPRSAPLTTATPADDEQEQVPEPAEDLEVLRAGRAEQRAEERAGEPGDGGGHREDGDLGGEEVDAQRRARGGTVAHGDEPSAEGAATPGHDEQADHRKGERSDHQEACIGREVDPEESERFAGVPAEQLQRRDANRRRVRRCDTLTGI